jgi:acetyl-CoA carboxylase biotin carboxyl carrier protein
MTFEEIKELIEVFDESNLAKLNIKNGDFKIELDKTSSVNVTPQITPQLQPQQTQTQQVVTQTPTPQVEENIDYIKSPMVGTFYQAPAPGKPPYVKIGDKVKKGQVVCIVEAMKIMNEVEAEFDCEILDILVEDGQAVEFDTPLFKVKRV